MAEVLSALASIYAPGPVGAVHGAPGVTLQERPHRTLIQMSGWPGSSRIIQWTASTRRWFTGFPIRATRA